MSAERPWSTSSLGAIHDPPAAAITLGAALHFDTWVPNFGIQEYMQHAAGTDAVFPHDYTFVNGYLFPGTRPGHGVHLTKMRLAPVFRYLLCA